jgi:hypothetical protein
MAVFFNGGLLPYSLESHIKRFLFLNSDITSDQIPPGRACGVQQKPAGGVLRGRVLLRACPQAAFFVPHFVILHYISYIVHTYVHRQNFLVSGFHTFIPPAMVLARHRRSPSPSTPPPLPQRTAASAVAAIAIAIAATAIFPPLLPSLSPSHHRRCLCCHIFFPIFS